MRRAVATAILLLSATALADTLITILVRDSDVNLGRVSSQRMLFLDGGVAGFDCEAPCLWGSERQFDVRHYRATSYNVCHNNLLAACTSATVAAVVSDGGTPRSTSAQGIRPSDVKSAITLPRVTGSKVQIKSVPR